MEYRYLLEKGSKKTHCPSCGKKRFVRYIDIEKQEYLPIEYGRCDREANCTYHLDPYKSGYAQEHENKDFTPFIPPKIERQIKFTPFSTSIFEQTLKGYEENTFINNLLNNIPFPFEQEQVQKIIELYYLGTITKSYRKGAITFPFIDYQKQVRTIQVKQFDTQNHTTGTDFLHSMLEKHYQAQHQVIPNWLKDYQENELKVSCLFGEHLLNKYPNNPIALVEAPKTAIYGTLYFGFPSQKQNFLWLAVYNLSSLNLKKCKVLQGRKVYLFPDLSKNGHAFEKWQKEAQKLQFLLPKTEFIVSNLLERYAPETDRLEGSDIADFLINLDWRNFQKRKNTNSNFSHVNTVRKPIIKEKTIQIQIESWDIQSLENFFNQTTLPEKFVLNGFQITNVSNFVKSHLQAIKTHNGKRTFLPYLHRLEDLKKCL